MRAIASFRLLLVPAALLAAACDESRLPQEPPTVEDEAPPPGGNPTREGLAGLPSTATRWADGYLKLTDAVNVGTPGVTYSFNRAGRGTINVVKPAGTTGRYIATFTGLSGYLGGRSTVHVSGYLSPATSCKPVAAYLVNDAVEVRCFGISTGQPADGTFSLLVTRNYPDLAFAFAHQPTSADYAPSPAGSSNPAGTTRVTRTGVGLYQVTFNNLGSQIPVNVGGHVQVNAVGTTSAYCNAFNIATNGSANLSVDVRCYTRTGAPADTKFTVLFLLPSPHLAYAWANDPTAGNYSPLTAYTSNPTGNATTISRSGVGVYTVTWVGADVEIFDEGNGQATAYGSNAQCKVSGTGGGAAYVRCYAPNGTPVDSRFMVLFGS